MADAGDAEALRALVDGGLADPEATWSLGGFGALAEFGRQPGEAARPIVGGGTGLMTARGGIRLDAADAVPIAYETAFAGGWSHAVALCLPRGRCLVRGVGVIAETGTDAEAIDPVKSGDNLFDLGLALPQGRFGLRTADPELRSRLRRLIGLSAVEAGSRVLDLVVPRAVDVVVSTPLGRIEVFAGAEPAQPGPRAFLVPRLLALGRTHAATAPIPAHLVPVATLHPTHPCRRCEEGGMRFDEARHAAFQALLARWGVRDLVALKHRLLAGEPPGIVQATRRCRGVARVVRVQAEALAALETRETGADDDVKS